MAGEVTFTNGISISGGGDLLLNQLLGELVNQTNFMEDLSNIQSEFFLTNTRAIGRNVKYSTLVGAVELDPIQENGLKPELERSKTPDKGFAIKEYGNQISTTYLMKEWIEKSTSLDGASPSVLEGWHDFMQNGQYLFNGAKLNLAIEAINLFYKGFSISAVNGPGSPTPKGKSMFAKNHSVRNNTITFRNTLSTADLAMSAGALQDALDTHKKELRFDNGYRVKLPKGAFELWVSRPGAVAARKILNTPGSQSDIYSGVAANAAQKNQFSFDGNTIQIKEFVLMGDIDKHGNQIGTNEMRFMINPDTAQEMKAIRYISLYDIFGKNYINNATDAYIADIRVGFAVDHYGVEAALVGSLGTI